MATELADFKKYISPDVLPCPDPIVERELIGTLMDFCKQTHVLTKDFNVDLTDADIDTGLQDAVDIDIREWISGYRPLALVRLNIDGLDYDLEYREILNTIENWEALKDDTKKYFFFVNDNTLRIYDMDTSDDDIYIRLAVKPKRSITEIEDMIYDDHVETIAAGTKYRILIMPGKPWTDRATAKDYFTLWRRGVTKARLNFDKGYTREPGTVYPRSFGGID